MLNCFSKTFTYIPKDRILWTVNDILKLVSVRHISAMQLKKCMRKGCKLYAVRVADLFLNENQTSLNEHPVLGEFLDVFPEEIPGLPPQWEIDFSI